MDVSILKKKYIEPIGTIQVKNQTLDERISKDYIINMASVLCILDRFEGKIHNKDILTTDFKSQRSYCIKFEIREDDEVFHLKLDVEFCIFLSRKTKLNLMEKFKDSYFGLGHENRRALIRTRNSLEKPKREIAFPDVTMFRVAEQAKKDVDKSISEANAFRELGMNKNALHILNGGYVPPNQAICQCLYMFMVALDEQNPNNADALKGFEAYFKGSLAAAEQNLNLYIDKICRDSKRIDINAKWIHKSKTIQEQNDDPLAWKNDSLNLTRCVLEIGTLSSDAEFWIKLQRVPFEKVKESFKCEKFRHQKLMSRSFSDPQAKVLYLARLLFSIADHVEKLTVPDGLPRLSLEIDSALSVINWAYYHESLEWIWNNRLDLIGLMNEIMEEIDQSKGDSLLPKGIQETLDRMHEDKIRPHQELQKRIQEERVRLGDRVGQAVVTNELTSLLDKRTLILDTYYALNISNPGVLGSLMAGFSGEGFLREVNERMAQIDELMKTLSSTEEDILSSYLSSSDLMHLTLAHRKACLELLYRTVVKHFCDEDFSYMSPDYFKYERAAMLSQCTNELQQITLLECIIDEFYNLPSKESLKNKIVDRDVNRQEEILKKAEEKWLEAKQIVVELEKKFLELVQRHPEVDIESKLKALGLRGVLPSSFEAILKDEERVVNFVDVLKIDQNLDRNVGKIKEVETMLVDLQKLFQPINFDNMIPVLQERNQVVFSEEFINQLRSDFNLAYKQLLKVKKQADDLIYKVRLEEKALGYNGEVEHYKVSLNVEDVDELRRNYSLCEQTNQDDLKLFCYIHEQRKTMFHTLYNKVLSDHLVKNIVPANPFDRRVDERLRRKSLKDWRIMLEDGKYDPTIKAYLLYQHKNLLLLEIRLFALYLNFCKPSDFKDKAIYKNFIALFQAIGSDKSPEFKKVIFNINKTVVAELESYKPKGRADDYLRNQRSFRKEIAEITRFKKGYSG